MCIISYCKEICSSFDLFIFKHRSVVPVDLIYLSPLFFLLFLCFSRILLNRTTSPLKFSLFLFVIPSPCHPSLPLAPHSSSPRLLSHLPSLFHLCSPRLSFPLPGHLFIQYGRPISAGSFPREKGF